jgi:hypothetical protein
MVSSCRMFREEPLARCRMKVTAPRRMRRGRSPLGIMRIARRLTATRRRARPRWRRSPMSLAAAPLDIPTDGPRFHRHDGSMTAARKKAQQPTRTRWLLKRNDVKLASTA